MRENKRKNIISTKKSSASAWNVTAEIFLLFTILVYPFYFETKYFSITAARADVFILGGSLYLIAASFILLYYALLKSTSGGKMSDVIQKDGKWYWRCDIWFLFLLLANFLAFLCAKDKQAAWIGYNGRLMGFKMYIVLLLVSVYLSLGIRPRRYLIYPLLFLLFCAVGLAVLQHLSVDPFRLREGIEEKSKNTFISLFGNRNVYGSFLAIMYGFAAGAFCFVKEKKDMILAAAAVLMVSIGAIPAGSDNVYLAIGVTMLLFFFICGKYGSIKRVVYLLLLTSGGNLFMVLLSFACLKNVVDYSGVAGYLGRPGTAGDLFFASLFAFVVLRFLEKRRGIDLTIQAGKRFYIVSASIILGAAVILVVFGTLTKNPLFVFDEKWGSGRGYIWSGCVRILKRTPFINLLFGHGNETFGTLMKEIIKEDGTEIAYDNAHNEFLQMLITTGIFGAAAWVMSYVSAIRRIWIGTVEPEEMSTKETRVKEIRKEELRTVQMAFLGGAAAYFASSLVTITQSITTPLSFVLLGAGVGIVRGYKKD